MSLIIKRGVIIRRLQYLTHRRICEELSKSREACDTMKKFLPSSTVPKRRSRLVDKIGLSFLIHPVLFNLKFKNESQWWKSPNNGDANGKNSPDPPSEVSEREEKINRMQELRERMIRHNLDHESVWKQVKERDEFGKKPDRKDEKTNEDENDKNNSS